MSNGDLSNFLVQRVNTELPKLELETAELQSHVNFLVADKYIDARERLRIQGEVMTFAMQLKHRISDVMSMTKAVTRRSMGDRYGTFRGNARAGMARLETRLDQLDESIDELRQKTHDEMNDPRRTSSESVSGIIDTVPEVINVLNDLAQFLGLLRAKRKASKKS